MKFVFLILRARPLPLLYTFCRTTVSTKLQVCVQMFLIFLFKLHIVTSLRHVQVSAKVLNYWVKTEPIAFY